MDTNTLIILTILALIGFMLLKDLLKMLVFTIAIAFGLYYLAKAGYLSENISSIVLNALSFFDKLDISNLVEKLSTIADKLKGGVLG